jgi:hypothetical protein
MVIDYIIDSYAHAICASHAGGAIADESAILAFLSMYEKRNTARMATLASLFFKNNSERSLIRNCVQKHAASQPLKIAIFCQVATGT